MLDFIGTIVLAAAIMVSVNALTGAMPISTSQRLALSVGAGLWTGLAAIGMMIVFRWLRPPLRRRSRRRCALRCSECRCLS
jgi:hypothetical protein